MDKKVIIYLGNFGRPQENAAGNRVYGNALLLSQIGYKVVLIGKSKSDHDGYPVMYNDDIEYYSFPNCPLYKTSIFTGFVQEIIKRVETPSFIIRYGTPGLAEFDRRLLKICKRSKIKLISDVVDWLPSGGNNVLFNLVKSINTYLDKAVYDSKSDGVIAISTYLESYYLKKNKKVVVIPPISERIKSNIKKNDAVQIIYAGIPFRLGIEIKDAGAVKDRLDIAVQTLGRIYETEDLKFEFHIYGVTKEEYLTAFPGDKRFTDNHGIFFHGRYPMADIKEKIGESDFSILLREKTRATMAGFPSKVVESMACGTPVITTRTSDLEKYIESGVDGYFVETENPEQLTKQLCDILKSSQDFITEMKKKCFENYKFEPSSYCDAMERFLSSLS